MRGTVQGLRAGTVFGFPFYLDASALYLGPWVLLIALTQSSSAGFVHALVFLVIAIASVLAHELAHAFAARALGVPVRHIALTWFGGYASFWVQPTRGRDAAIAFAGPAANLSVGALLLAGSAMLPGLHTAEISGRDLIVSWRDPTLLEYAVRTGAFFNLVLGAFNLLPGLPLDGGHILRASLSTRMSWGRASWIAAWLGIIIGALAVGYAVWIESFPILFLGLFVSHSAWQERRALRYD